MDSSTAIYGICFTVAGILLFVISLKGKGDFFTIKSWWMGNLGKEDVRGYNRAIGVFWALILFFVGIVCLGSWIANNLGANN